MNQPVKPSARLMAEQWQAMIDQQQASGVNQKTFCHDHDIALATFSNWKRKLRHKPSVTPKQTTIQPVEKWIEIPSATETASQHWHLELELPGGVILRMRQ